MSNLNKKIKICILEMSSQNKAILEFFFDNSGKSLFEETSINSADAYIIDHDYPGAKDMIEEIYNTSKTPGIVISIKEVNSPNTVWLAKPLTISALKNAKVEISEIIETHSDKENIFVTMTNEKSENTLNQDDKNSLIQEIEKEKRILSELSSENKEVEEFLSLKENTPENNITVSEEIIGAALVSSQAKQHTSINKTTKETPATEPAMAGFDLSLDILEDELEDEASTEKNEVFEDKEVDIEIDKDIDDLLESLISEDSNAIEKRANDINPDQQSLSEQKPKEDLFLNLKSFDEEPSDEEKNQSKPEKTDDDIDIDSFLENPDEVMELEKIINKDESEFLAKHKTERLEVEDFIQEQSATNTLSIDDINLDEVTNFQQEVIDSKETNENHNDQEIEKPPLSESELEELIDSNNYYENIIDETIAELQSVDEFQELNTNNDEIIQPEAEAVESIQTEVEVTPIEESTEEPIEEIIEEEKQEEKLSAEEELQSLLEEIRHEAEGKNPLRVTNKGKSSEGSSYTPTFAEERWALTCGTNDNPTSKQRKIAYNPTDYMLHTLLQVITQAKQTQKVLRLKFSGVIIVILPDTDTIYCDTSIYTDAYAQVCFKPIKKENIKIHNLDNSEIRLYRKISMEDVEDTHSTESFIWTTSLLTSRGRLPKGTDTKKIISLKHWPNLTRLETIPHVMRIAAVFYKYPGSLKDMPNWLNIDQRYVFSFYNAVLSLNLISIGSQQASTNNKNTAFKKTKNRGFFSRLLKRINI